MEDGAVGLAAAVAMQANSPRCFIQCRALHLRANCIRQKTFSPSYAARSQIMYHALGSKSEAITL